MNKSLITYSITIIMLLSSCLSFNKATPASDSLVLQTIFKNHPPPVFSVNGESASNSGMTFDEFSKYLVYTREDVDINGDEKKEILLSGSMRLPNWAFFIMYTNDSQQQLQELQYLETVGWYLAEAQFKVTHPYVLVDFLTASGGTGFFVSGSKRNIVRCKDTVCDSISYRYFSADTLGSYDVSSLGISGDQLEIKINGLYVEAKPFAETVCDPTGKEYSSREARKHYYVDISYYHKYSWENNHFVETDYQETPAFEVPGFFDGIYTGVVPSIIKETIEPDATIQQSLDTYYDFFGASSDERNSPPTISCDEINKDSNWLPYSIPTTVYQEVEDQDYFAAVNNTCKLVVWKKSSAIFNPKLNDLEIIGRENLVDCNPEFISFQWMNITGSDLPELIITSGISKQIVWIYDVSQSVRLIHQATGFSRENPLVGAQLQKTGNDIVLKVGLPRSNGQCLDAFKCFSLDKEFEVFRWNNETQTFSPVR